MRLAPLFAAPAGLAVARAVALSHICTRPYAQSALPSYPGVVIDPGSLSATAVSNYSTGSSDFYPSATFDYCNVTFAYAHSGRNDRVLVTYWLPAPDAFRNRFLATGGGGLAINSGSSSVAGGLPYGAAVGLTDGGFGGFDTNWDSVFLLANSTVNWESVYMFGYQGIHEMTAIGKAFTQNFFNSSGSRLYTYYQGCSEGGREGWSQVQRYGGVYDGVIAGAPAFRFAFQQVQHLYSNVVEQTLGYYPPPCELETIVNLTVAACDPLDGLVDGVVSRTDLCKLDFNINSTIGQPYHCPASSAGGFPGGPPGASSGSLPAQNGFVTAQGVAVARKILDGLHDSQGRRVYMSYQPTADFEDAQTSYDNATESWSLEVSGLGGEWVERYLNLQNSSTLPSLNNVTYDTLKAWVVLGLQRYLDSLETTWPDLNPFRDGGGKVIHFHGESDPSIPTASSVRYFESVRQIMYSQQSYNDSVAELKKWYKLFLVPGAAHCSTNPGQPNGPFPQTTLQVMIDWVEKGQEPVTLNATVLTGTTYLGQNRQICAWPLRPIWRGNDTSSMECEYDQRSINTWLYDLDAIKVPVF